MVSRFEGLVTAAFVFIITFFGSIFGFTTLFASATGTDGAVAEFGSQGVLWGVGFVVAMIALFNIKRNSRK